MAARPRRQGAAAEPESKTMKKRPTPITQEMLQQAIAKYLRGGGRIQKLPEQKTGTTTLVGRRWSSTEIEPDLLH